jgi:UDPglucose 6-dehydrogenase
MLKITPDFDMAMNPETMAEGTACADLAKPDRIMVGRINRALDPFFEKLYKAQTIDDPEKLRLYNSFESAELAKYAANGFLSTKTSFVNETARLAAKVGADIREVTDGMARDSRIGKFFLHPSKHGYGGSCFDKDIKGMEMIGKSFGLPMHLSRANHESNAYCIEDAVNDIVKYFDGGVRDQIVGVWGLAFKQGTDDVRNSQQLDVVKRLLDLGAIVQAHDPKAMEHVRFLCEKYPKLHLVEGGKYPAARNARALIIQTEWSHYRNPEFEELKSLMHMPALIADHKTLFNPQDITDAGFDYLGAGRQFRKAGSKPLIFHRELPELK